MTAATWITMIAILLFVWGGFAVALVIAVRKEAVKRQEGPPAADRRGAPNDALRPSE